MREFRPAAAFALADLTALLNRCYAGYPTPVYFDVPGYERMVRWCDLDLESSRICIEDGVPLGLAMLGLRGDDGWVGGMGVVEERRRGGHGRAIMIVLIEEARRVGVRNLDLEVLTNNAGARALYDSLGFRPIREVVVWVREPGPTASAESPNVEMRSVEPAEILAAIEREMPRPPWQRDVPTLRHVESELTAWVGVDSAPGEARLLTREQNGVASILDMAVSSPVVLPMLDRLIDALIERTPGAVRLLNWPAGHMTEAALVRAGFTAPLRQTEMRLVL
jgi:ribosomal protein S18 acetylase RimI-like enzyme